MRHAGRASAVLASVLLAACSATDFSPPALAFGQAVTEGGRLVEVLDQERAEANFALRRAAIAQRADQVVVRAADCRAGAAAGECVLRAGPGRTPMGQVAPAARPGELVAALERYAEGLAGVASARDDADLDVASRQLEAALDSLGRAVPQTGAAGMVVGPAPGILANIRGLASGQRRFAVLQNAINAADPAVQQAAGELAATVAGQREAALDDRAALIARLAALYNATEPRPGIEGAAASASREALLARLAALTAAQRQLLADEPSAELRRLGEAHAALRAGINDPTPPHAALTNELRRLAERLRRAADAAMRLPLA